MKKIAWSPFLLLVAAGGILVMIGFSNVVGGGETDFFFTAGMIVGAVGAVLYVRERTKKEGVRKLVVRRKRNENLK